MIDRSLFNLPGIRATLARIAALNAALGALAVAQAWSLALAISSLWAGGPLSQSLAPALAFPLCYVLRQAVRTLQDAWMERYASARAGELRRSLLERVYDEGPALVQKAGSGGVSALALEGISQVETYLELILPKMVGVVVVPAIVLAAILSTDPVSGVIALACYPVTVLYMVMLGKTAQERAARRHAEFMRLSNHFIDSLRGIETLRLFGRSRAHAGRIFSVSESFREATMKTIAVATLSSAALDLIATFGLAGIAILLGFRLSDGEVSLLPALFVLIMVPDYFAPLRAFASDFHASLDGKNALAAIANVISTPRDHRGGAPAGPKAPLDSSRASVDDAFSWGRRSTLELSAVSYSYDNEREALDNVSLTVRDGMRVGLIGLSGAGKSTLASLLAGFISPDAGDILLDGKRVPSLCFQGWRQQVAYIPQAPYIFHATLAQNIAFYRPDADRDQIEAAVDAMGLRELVDELPQGLDTLIGEAGRPLSGGESHRVALARALLDPSRRVLILDEPTAHLDIETEMELKDALLPLFSDRLVIFATHRLHWVDQMDLVLVMDSGRLVQTGRPDQLKTTNGYLALAGAINGEDPREADDRKTEVHHA